MKYSYDYENITIYYANPIVVDIEQHIRILNHFKCFRVDDVYPSYTYNKKKVNMLEYLFSCPEECLEQKNENKYDLRTLNMRCKVYPEAIFVYTKRHSIWKINDDHYIMICLSPVVYIVLDGISFDKIREMDTNFVVNKEGYIRGKQGYLHELLLGKKNVEHIDKNPLNNRMDNLCIATRTKRARKKTAIELPVGMTQDMLRTYVVYYKECYNREKQLYREFFKIEKHPMLEKPWCTSKSNKIHIMDKLKHANERAHGLMMSQM
jgi:hypothetical protein